ncbi:cupin domain-containing protein [Amycolatopsis australiensis]|uniref:Cupin domain-containing protein n=1 Tax=Amycolatopsis australiensis TaxID=546364 RepID=A0A1K1SAV8_9PSEU|nr:cupin domain-containing protein [Amycolatopsis australiensis]SFW81362.1 Cupin domain-containing protein [Amycolatopsis australiensis]
MTVALTSPETAENLDRAGGRGMRLLLDSAATSGTLSVLLCEAPAAEAGPPLHVHPGSDETFVVLEGTLLLHAAGRTHPVPAGGSMFVPRGTPHTFATASGRPVRFVTIHTPGGFERMHRDVRAAESEAGRPLAPPEMIAIARRHDWEPAGPPLLPTGELAPAPAPR